MRRHPLLLIAWLLLVALPSSILQAEPDPRKVAAEFFRGVYACNPSAVGDLAGDDIVVSYPIFETLFGSPAIRGREAVVSFAEGFCSRWAEAEVTIHEAIADEGKVVLVWSFSARSVGSSREDTPPPGERQSWGGMTLYYFDSNGKITAEIGEESEPGPIARSQLAARESTVRRIPVATVGCGGEADQPSILSAEDLGAIASLRRALTEAIVAGDAAAYAELCTEDVRLLHTDAPLLTGRVELRDHNAAIFEATTVTHLELSPVEVCGVGDLAYEVGTQELAVDPAMPGFSSSRKYVHVLRRGTDGQWRFAALISNDSRAIDRRP